MKSSAKRSCKQTRRLGYRDTKTVQVMEQPQMDLFEGL